MAYRELPPPPEIASHVACLWMRSGGGARIVPDGCSDLVWTGRDLIVAGPSTQAFIAGGLVPGAMQLGVRFRIGAAGSALGVPARDVRDLSPRVADVWSGSGSELTERLGDAPSAAARMRLLVDVLTHRLRAADPVDPVVRGAVLDIARPGVRVTGLGGGELGERQMRRRFDAAVGYAPKTLAGVLRLQRFLALARRGVDGLAGLALDAGYSDQAHLTRECVRLTGATPTVLLADGTWAAGEVALSSG